MSARTKKHNFGGILVLLVFTVFTVSILMILLNGADIVQKISDRDGASFERRTAAQYISTKVRQADQAEMISVRDDVLVLAEEIDGYVYETLIYCHDGYLREMFCEAGMAQEPEFGEKILPLEAMQAELEGDALRVGIVFADGDGEQLIFGLHSEGSVTES